MHLNGIGNIRQNQGFHGLIAIIEEPLLHIDNAGGYLEQGVVAALQALDEPFGFLNAIAQILAVFAAGVAGDVGVLLLQVDPGEHVVVEADLPAALMLTDDHVGNGVVHLGLADLLAGGRVQGA